MVPCSSLIISVLERRFPSSAGYGTLFPRGKHGRSSDTGLIKAFSKYYVDKIFSLGPLLLPWDKFNPDFIKDRSTVSQLSCHPKSLFRYNTQFLDAPLDIKAIQAARPQTISKLASYYVCTALLLIVMKA